ncbi:DUF4336 domain-containing protein [Stakelama tenebrarum]|uniref:DUF4336 domain-containing protein n=1 Tax=Stakelama tenebrarum TaxID=2711215 RepID=A0A6G6Y0Z7_9SPHN|nr:DUF4336 domain-containing protein [Sphingosinithalassobacter tenebrarum]QIG78388.1 DUF4336 domain-containing protein [Sphingosinithalassobacter tenebrarum]
MAGRHDNYRPLNVPKPVADDIWIVDGPSIGFNMLGFSIPFPTRMTVVRLPDGGLWLHSPIAWHDGLGARLADIGPVRHLVAPNTIHYWYLPDWAKRYPEAQVHLVPGLPEKAKRPMPDGLPLTEEAPEAWAGTIDQLLVCGSIFNEADFFHRPSRTLILTDLIENFEPERVHPWPLRKLIQWVGAAAPKGSTPRDMRLSFLRHRKQVRAAAKHMLEWEPERLIMAHGAWHAEGGKEALRRGFRWVL